jgi:hypothetical protein
LRVSRSFCGTESVARQIPFRRLPLPTPMQCSRKKIK